MRKERDGLLYGPYERPEKMELCYDWYDDGPPQGNSLRQRVICVKKVGYTIGLCLRGTHLL